jgi:hypothetical protein
MLSPIDPESQPVATHDLLDRLAMGYVYLPLFLFLGGWFEWWAALPLLACAVYAARPLIARRPDRPTNASQPPERTRFSVTSLQIAIAVVVGSAWAVLGGTDHWVFANADWHIRDAVLHDLVDAAWPVGYGELDGQVSLLRASIGYFLPAALIGKAAGLAAAHVALLAWTAAGASLFLLQVLSLTRSRLSTALLAAAIVVLFSGLDIVGSLLNDGPRFRSDWNITTHLEWWAQLYQYSSMTTQLFWVPNHALAGWLLIGLLYRNAGAATLDASLPMLAVAAALWSPLSAIGLVPFIAWKLGGNLLGEGSLRKALRLLHPLTWVPALIVGAAVAAYLTLDPGNIPKGFALAGNSADDDAMNLLRQAQFFLLEAGFIGAAILALRRSVEVILALALLAVLPLLYLGPGNDLVMRASIPSLAILAIASCLALVEVAADRRSLRNKAILCGLLIVGAMTPLAEIARAILLPIWPVNLQASLVGASCGAYPPHYVARLGGEAIGRILRRPSPMPLGPKACVNPAMVFMWQSLGRISAQSAAGHRATDGRGAH